MGAEGLVIRLDMSLCNYYPKLREFLSDFNFCLLMLFQISRMFSPSSNRRFWRLPIHNR
jgi:hypothetical protein